MSSECIIRQFKTEQLHKRFEDTPGYIYYRKDATFLLSVWELLTWRYVTSCQPSVSLREGLGSVSTWQSLKENEEREILRQWVTLYWFYCIVLWLVRVDHYMIVMYNSSPAWIASLLTEYWNMLHFFRQWVIKITICSIRTLFFKCFSLGYNLNVLETRSSHYSTLCEMSIML